METNTAERLEQAVAALNDLITLTRGCGLRDSAQFLAMAKLHLLMDLNGVSDVEFRALCDALEGKAKSGARSARTRGTATRNRRDTEMRLMRRARQCAPGMSPRGGHSRARQ